MGNSSSSDTVVTDTMNEVVTIEENIDPEKQLTSLKSGKVTDNVNEDNLRPVFACCYILGGSNCAFFGRFPHCIGCSSETSCLIFEIETCCKMGNACDEPENSSRHCLFPCCCCGVRFLLKHGTCRPQENITCCKAQAQCCCCVKSFSIPNDEVENPPMCTCCAYTIFPKKGFLMTQGALFDKHGYSQEWPYKYQVQEPAKMERA